MASIRKRSTSSWEAQVRMRGWETQTRTFMTKADAVQWATGLEVEMRRGAYIDTSGLRSQTLAELLVRYAAEVTPGKKSAESEGYRLRAMMRLPMARLSLDRLTVAMVVEWQDTRKGEVSGDTVVRELNLLSSVINHARREWQLPMGNPVEAVGRPSQGRGRKRRPSWSELRKLLRALTPQAHRAEGYWAGARNPWIRPAVVFALRTAMRRGEILAMRWEHVHFRERHVHLPDTKNGTSRDVPLSRKAEQMLKRLPAMGDTGPVFPVTADALKKAFVRALERAGVEDLRFHDFRHDATTRLAERLSNVLELSAVTGHKSLNMLHRYYNPKPEALALKLD